MLSIFSCVSLAGVFLTTICHCCSVAVVSDSLQSHRLQHTRLPCPSLSPGVCSHSCPLSWWCHPTISSFAAFFSSCSQLRSLTTRPPGKPQKHFFKKLQFPFYLFILAVPRGMEDLCSLTWDQTYAPWHWKHAVSPTGLPGKIHRNIFWAGLWR